MSRASSNASSSSSPGTSGPSLTAHLYRSMPACRQPGCSSRPGRRGSSGVTIAGHRLRREEPEGVEVRAAQLVRLDDRVGAGLAEPQRRRRADARTGGTPSPTRAVRSSRSSRPVPRWPGGSARRPSSSSAAVGAEGRGIHRDRPGGQRPGGTSATGRAARPRHPRVRRPRPGASGAAPRACTSSR